MLHAISVARFIRPNAERKIVVKANSWVRIVYGGIIKIFIVLCHELLCIAINIVWNILKIAISHIQRVFV